jgi:hypothetical protein
MPPDLTSVVLPSIASLRELALELRLTIERETRWNDEFEVFIARMKAPSFQLSTSLVECRKATERLVALHRFVAHLADHEGAVFAFLQSLPPPKTSNGCAAA